jgi:secreted PhoX family phosphatase
LNKQPILRLWQFVLLLSATSSCFAADQTPSMLRTLPDSGFTATALFTVGDRIGNYQPPGVLDGLAAFRQDDGTLRLFVNHELAPGAGYPFTLANGTQLVGSRISYMDIDPQTKSIVKAGPAFDRVRDRAGQTVTHARQINELPADNRSGLNDLCSAAGYRAGEFGFVDDLYFTHEEATARGNHPHGGSVWVLDINERELWALPELGRGSWENSAAVATPDMHEPDGHIALLLGDDLEFGGAPLYLWIGRKQPAGNLPARNGLSSGKLYVWVSDKKDRSADDWRGTGKTRNGQFVSIAARDINRAKQPGYDAAGYLDDLTLRKTARALGAFQFSRPEDLHTNPVDGQQVVFASTGHGREFPDDDWGTLYLIKMEFEQDKNGQLNASARLEILHDGDDFAGKGIRNPDNLVWAQDGNVYVQEDMATRLHRFGGKNKQETSTWRINPEKPKQFTRLAEIDRSVILPADATDTQANKLGKWESSGIIDVTEYFPAATGRVLLATVQAHSLRGGSLGGSNALVQGGQIILLEEHIAPE